MTLRETILCALWVERVATTARLAELTTIGPPMVRAALHLLLPYEWVELGGLGSWRITALGDARARVILAERNLWAAAAASAAAAAGREGGG